VACAALPGAGISPVAVSVAIEGLTPDGGYHYRIVAANAGGSNYGSDVAFTTATPELPELGRCVRLAQAPGAYRNPGCTKKSTGGHPGRYVREPWPAAKNHFSFTNSRAIFETPANAKIECASSQLTGEYDSPQTAVLQISFTGCEAPGALGVAPKEPKPVKSRPFRSTGSSGPSRAAPNPRSDGTSNPPPEKTSPPFNAGRPKPH
jgi:hypothetical protein